MKIMDGNDALILWGLMAAVGVGIAVGCFNFALIRLLSIPPIIATLSASFLVQSASIAYGRGPVSGPWCICRIHHRTDLGYPDAGDRRYFFNHWLALPSSTERFTADRSLPSARTRGLRNWPASGWIVFGGGPMSSVRPLLRCAVLSCRLPAALRSTWARNTFSPP